ncbi:hypothetical protein PAMA_002900 [Pampus argenteus]
MALPVRTNLRHVFRFIQKLHSPNRPLCRAYTGASGPAAKLQPVRAGGRGCLPCLVIFGALRALSAGSAVFEGPPVPLISLGTPRRERALSPGLPHCSVLFLYPRSLHSVKLRGTSSISPVPHVNRRFNQTLLLGLPLRSPLQHPLLEEKKRSKF